MGTAILPLWLVLRAAAAMPPAPPPVAPAPQATRPIRRVETQQPQVALTFDACATKNSWYGFDQDVFEVLKREHVPATIFVSGLWVETHPEAMSDLTGDPLIEFGDHSYDHPHMTKLAPAQAGAEIDETEAALGRYGRRAVAFRPPFGDWDAHLVRLVRARQLPTVTWDVVSGDPSTHSTTAGIVKAVLKQARPGSIIVFHINGRGWKTHEALPEVVAGLRARGFKLVPLSELLQAEGRGGGQVGVQAAASEARPPGP
ncbi:MAG TPA: polysaccharide deacetylase family protein [Polyangia bacterium]|nr:polysaccharide deacetylase family protein [Polyangia bacterium]